MSRGLVHSVHYPLYKYEGSFVSHVMFPALNHCTYVFLWGRTSAISKSHRLWRRHFTTERYGIHLYSKTLFQTVYTVWQSDGCEGFTKLDLKKLRVHNENIVWFKTWRDYCEIGLCVLKTISRWKYYCHWMSSIFLNWFAKLYTF